MIQIENITKRYGEVLALDNISMEVSEGERFGLIGPDGAGKTTLIRILATLLVANEGIATVAGLDVQSDYRKLRNMLGYMPGTFSLYQDLTIEENLKLFATIFGTKLEDNYDLISGIYSQIEPFKKRRAGDLSGGMKQKLALSCALIHRPKVLLLDEPTTGVDAVSRREFWDMLDTLKAEGITVFVSTPYMDEAARCERVALIQDGKILQIDTPKAIEQSFPYELMAVSSNDTYKLLLDLREFPHSKSVFPFGDSVHLTDSRTKAHPQEVEEFLSARGHSSVSVRIIQPDIEDAFMELMNQVTIQPLST